MSSSLYRSYFSSTNKISTASYTFTPDPSYTRMSHLPECTQPISRGCGGRVSQGCESNIINSGVAPGKRGRYLLAGLRSGNPNLVSTWKNSEIYK